MAISRRKALVGLLPHAFTLGFGLFFICRLVPAATTDPLAWVSWLAGWGLAVLGLESPVRGRNLWLAAAVLLPAWLLAWNFSATAHLWQFFWLGYAVIFGREVRRGWLQDVRLNHSVWAEGLRWLLLGLAALAVLHPFATASLVGGGDAKMYAQLLADALAQFRATGFPMLVGQSDYAFNGDIHPLRTAPGFFYAGGLLDALTLRSLPAVAVQNLLIVLNGLAAVFVLYRCLVRLVPGSGWTAWLLALLFLTCPGVLAPIYSGDMVASWMTLPWLPLLFFALVRMVDRPAELRWPAQATVALAALWLFHAPIAFWSTVCALPFAVWHVARRFTKPRLLESLGLLGLFALLAGFVFASVITLDLPGDDNLRAAVNSGAILSSLKLTWHGFFRPVSPGAVALLSDLQLSPGLWLVLAFGVMSLGRVARASGWLLGAVILALVVLLLPPLDALWRIMPDAVLNTTDKWPAQRFFLILSAAVPFLALPALASFRRTHPRFLTDTTIVVIAACAWSLVESVKYVRRGWSITHSAAVTRQTFLPENVRLSRYAYEYYGRLPRYHTDGPAEPLALTRLLARDTLEPSVTNSAFLLGSATHQGETAFSYEATDYGGRFTPQLGLASDTRYLLHFDFHGGLPEGALQVAGHDVFAEYILPDSGEERAFGARPGHDHTLTLWHRELTADTAEIKFIRTPGSAKDLPAPTLRVIPFAGTNPPLQLRGLIPFRVAVRSDTPAWLETPKMFVPGYRARVDGQPVPVALSPDGLVMLPVPAGTSTVELSYPGPLVLRVAFWVGGIAWLGVVLYFFALPAARLRLPAPPVLLAGLGRVTVVVALAAGLFAVGRMALSRDNSMVITSDGRTSAVRHFPVGRPRGTVETVMPLSLGSFAGTLVVDCVDGKRARLGFQAVGAPAPVFGEPFPVNYLAAQHLECFPPPDRPGALQVRVNERLVLDLPGPAPRR